jgi:hypothetical protein
MNEPALGLKRAGEKERSPGRNTTEAQRREIEGEGLGGFARR